MMTLLDVVGSIRTKMFSVLTLFTVILLGMSVPAVVRAQTAPEYGKHARVAEVENIMVKDATTFLKSRFPNLPFLVSVSVDPLRRVETAPKSSADRLPYFEEGDEEIQDEWDNPNVSTYALMPRIKRAVVTVSVPSNITDDEIAEVRNSMLQVLNLTAARDEIVIQKRAWTQMTDNKADSQTVILFSAIGFAAVLLALAGLFLITRTSIKTIGSAIGTQAAKAAGGGGGGAAASIQPMAADTTDSRRGGGAPSGDLKFSDPIRMREVLLQSIRVLCESDMFPTLQDLMVLDRAGKKNPGALGALLSEFSGDLQKRLFSYSFQNHWLEALVDPGEVNSEVLETLSRLMRVSRGSEDVALQKLLIYVWRLDGQMAEYLRAIDHDESLAILAHLPKTVSVGAARAAFPGNWGAVLDTQFKPKPLSRERIEKLALKAMQMKALRDFSILEQYRQERDLLEYLSYAEPTEEKEIYLASPPQSVIHSMRPPFYRVFELTSDELDRVVSRISLDDWALALLNTGRNDRREIEKKFSEKQRFLLVDKLKKLDQTAPDRAKVGQARERIARVVKTEVTDSQRQATREAPQDDSNETQAA